MCYRGYIYMSVRTEMYCNVEKESIETIRNNSRFQILRKNMQVGTEDSACSRCYFLEAQGHESERTIQNAVWASQFKEFDFDKTSVTEDPVYLDIRLSNLCNLKCRMCSGYFSSSIQQEENEIWGIKNKSQVLNKRERADSIEYILKILPSVEKLYFAGGEPLMSPEHYQMLDRIVALGKTNIDLNYTTNFTRLTHGKHSALDLWSHFSRVKVLASLDADYSVAEYVRHGTVWKDVLENYELVRHLDNIDFSIMSTVGFMNVENLMRMQKNWVADKDFDLNKWFVHAMIGPENLTLSVLPVDHKSKISSNILAHAAWCSEQGAYKLASQWQSIDNYMMNNDNTHHLLEFNRLTKIMDTHRNESFSNVFPEFAYLLT